MIAWVGFTSIGIFMARFMQVAFGEKVLLCSKVRFTVRCCLSMLVLKTFILVAKRKENNNKKSLLANILGFSRVRSEQCHYWLNNS